MEQIPPVKDVPIAMGHVEDVDLKGGIVTDLRWTDDGFLLGIVIEHNGLKYTIMPADDSPSQLLELFLHKEQQSVVDSNKKIWQSLPHKLRKEYYDARKKSGGKLRLSDWYVKNQIVER